MERNFNDSIFFAIALNNFECCFNDSALSHQFHGKRDQKDIIRCMPVNVRLLKHIDGVKIVSAIYFITALESFILCRTIQIEIPGTKYRKPFRGYFNSRSQNFQHSSQLWSCQIPLREKIYLN